MTIDGDEPTLSIRLTNNKGGVATWWRQRGRRLEPVDKAQVPCVQMAIGLRVVERDHWKG